jgi:hypothetical protein
MPATLFSIGIDWDGALLFMNTTQRVEVEQKKGTLLMMGKLGRRMIGKWSERSARFA